MTGLGRGGDSIKQMVFNDNDLRNENSDGAKVYRVQVNLAPLALAMLKAFTEPRRTNN